MRREKVPSVEKADAKGPFWDKGSRIYHRFLKRRKNRLERRKAKRNPECTPTYGKYKGYET